jgi:predicted outer membrane protein
MRQFMKTVVALSAVFAASGKVHADVNVTHQQIMEECKAQWGAVAASWQTSG